MLSQTFQRESIARHPAAVKATPDMAAGQDLGGKLVVHHPLGVAERHRRLDGQVPDLNYRPVETQSAPGDSGGETRGDGCAIEANQRPEAEGHDERGNQGRNNDGPTEGRDISLRKRTLT